MSLTTNVLYQVWRSTDPCQEFYSWEDTDLRTYNAAHPTARRKLYTEPPAAEPVPTGFACCGGYVRAKVKVEYHPV